MPDFEMVSLTLLLFYSEYEQKANKENPAWKIKETNGNVVNIARLKLKVNNQICCFKQEKSTV